MNIVKLKIKDNPVVPKKQDEEIPVSSKAIGLNPELDEKYDQFPDLSEPIEFKDVPVSFTLHLDRRQEAIKVVEPEMDFPLPEGGRLVVKDRDVCLTDVVFRFNVESDRPYELHFAVHRGVHAKDHVLTFGAEKDADKNLIGVYTEKIVERGSLQARIEMTHGKARLAIKYGHVPSSR